MNIKIKYIGYIRKSSESDERQIQSIEDQSNILKPLAERKSLHIIDWIKESHSAKKPGRPLFKEMLIRIEKGEANGIVGWDPSRLSRNSVDTGQLIFLMDEGKLEEIVTASQTFRNTPNDKFLLSLLCSVAKKENDDKSENIKRALVQRAERGDPIGPPRPGYRSIPNRRQGERGHEPDPVYFPLFKDLLKKYLSCNYSVYEIVKEAKKLGIKNYKGKDISKTSMYRLLQDPYYIGKILFKGILSNANHPAMLTESEFNIIQAILTGKKHRIKQKHYYLLGNSLIKCGACRYSIRGDTHIKNYKNGSSQSFTYYICSQKGKNCLQAPINAKELEDQAIKFLSSLEIDSDFVEWAIETLSEQNAENTHIREAQRQSLKSKLDGIERRIDNLNEMMFSPKNTHNALLSEDEYLEMKSRLITERDKIHRDYTDFDTQSDKVDELILKTFSFSARLKERYELGSLEDKRNILKAVGANLILLDKKLYIQARTPFKLLKGVFEKIKPQMERGEPMFRLLQQSNTQFYTDLYRVRESN